VPYVKAKAGHVRVQLPSSRYPSRPWTVGILIYGYHSPNMSQARLRAHQRTKEQ